MTRHAGTVEAVWREMGERERVPVLVALTLAQIDHESKGNPNAVSPKSGAAGVLQLLSSDLRQRAAQLGGLYDVRAQVQTYAETVKNVERQGGGLPEAAWRWASGLGAVRASIKNKRPTGAPPRLPDATVAKQLRDYISPMLSRTYREYARWYAQEKGIADELPRVWDGVFKIDGREWRYSDGDPVDGVGRLGGVAWGWAVGAAAAVGAAVYAATRRLKRGDEGEGG